jgi:hypothetical protein
VFAHGVEGGQRVGLIEGEQLTLAGSAQEFGTGCRTPPHEGAHGGFDGLPGVEQIGGQVFGVARRVQPGNRAAGGVNGGRGRPRTF